MTGVTCLLNDDGTVTLCTGRWSQRFSVGELPAKIRFYHELWAGLPPKPTAARLAVPGRYARFYQPTLDALRAVAAQVRT